MYAAKASSYPGPGSMKLQSRTAFTTYGTTWYATEVVDAPADGALAPTVNTFPDGAAAELVSTSGGFVVRGNGTGAWPALTTPLTQRLDAAEANIQALDLRLDNLEDGDAIAEQAWNTAPSSYPLGSSHFYTSAAVGWPSTYGLVTTVFLDQSRARQTFTTRDGDMWVRGATSNVWGAWIPLTKPEVWHNVGAAGEPAFQNSWAVYNVAWTPPRFKKDTARNIHVQGMIAGGANNTTMFTLPAAYRPAKNVLKAMATSAGSGRVDLQSDGQVINRAGAGLSWVSLDFVVQPED